MHVGVVFSKTFLLCPKVQTILKSLIQREIALDLGHIYSWEQDFWASIKCFHMTSRRPYWCPKTKKRRPCWCPKPVLLELNSFLMQTLSFVPINLHRCWPREWKHSIHLFQLRLLPWNMMHDAWWFAFHGLRCIVVDLLVMFVHACARQPIK